MTKVLLTGATGFLGIQIANYLQVQYELIGLKRKSSDLSGLTAEGLNIQWIDLDDDDWTNKVLSVKPDVIIHSAWIGVEAADRNDWGKQSQNILLLQQLLSLAEQCGTRTFIGMGSQAEYGTYSGIKSEHEAVKPNDGYGAAKVFCSEILNAICTRAHINWYWLRLFSFFGEGERETWLIPSVIKKIINKEVLELTPGEQRYAYLYAGNLGLICEKFISGNADSGIYNISSENAISIKELIETIRDAIDPTYPLIFGKLPYREGQAMHMQGDMTKLNNAMGKIQFITFQTALQKTILYYKNLFNRKTNEGI